MSQSSSHPASKTAPRPTVGILMGSASDWASMRPALDTLASLGIAAEARVISAHRAPLALMEYARGARRRGLRCIIAGAGAAAHLPGVTAAFTELPVLGVPISSRSFEGLDALLAIAQMPAGIPVATFPLAPDGARQAARFAARFAARPARRRPRRPPRLAAR